MRIVHGTQQCILSARVSLLDGAIPALAAHVVHTHIPQRRDAVVSMDLGVIADQEPEDVWLGPQHCVVDRAAPLGLVHGKSIRALFQQVCCARCVPACIARCQVLQPQRSTRLWLAWSCGVCHMRP